MDGKRLVFAGAAPVAMGTPWGTLALVVRRALEPLGYETEFEIASWGDNSARYVADGMADLGATQYRSVRYAWDGLHAFAAGGPRRNLRLVATINQPAWIGMAVRAESGITDLSEIAKRQLPVRIKTSGDGVFDLVFEYYGLSRETIRSFGGRFLSNLGSEDINPASRWANGITMISPSGLPRASSTRSSIRFTLPIRPSTNTGGRRPSCTRCASLPCRRT